MVHQDAPKWNQQNEENQEENMSETEIINSKFIFFIDTFKSQSICSMF